MVTLVDLIEGATKRFGDRLALSMKPGIRAQRLSYQELWEASSRVSGFLAANDVVAGDRVLVWAPNSPEWVAFFLGCLRSGVAVVPVDLRSTLDFVRQVELSTLPKMRLVSRVTPAHEELAHLPELALERFWTELPESGAALTLARPRPDDLAEILFTSGTTGDPKGVMLTQQSIAVNVQNVSLVVAEKQPHRLLSLLPLSHMFEQTVGLLLALHEGWSVFYPTSRQPSVLFRTLAENRITALVVVPQALQLFWNAVERQVKQSGRERIFAALLRVAPRMPIRARRLLFGSLHRRLGGAMRLYISGGAFLDIQLARNWEATGIQVVQGYGATEASPIIACLSVGDHRLESVGRSLPNQEVRIAPDGEVLARGANLTTGYWNNPAATAASFEGDWYRTGDLGELDSQGYLYLRGRKKNMIVLGNGQNVYPEDIEAALLQSPGISDVVVLGRPAGGEITVHAVFLGATPEAAEAAVKSANAHLADHQHIQGYSFWPGDDFPRTHTLKVKRANVQEYLDQFALEPSAPLPVSGLAGEADPLKRIVAELSGLAPDQQSPELTLGDGLGLDSLRRVELLSAIEAELGIYIDDTAVNPDTTLAELTLKMQEAVGGPPIHFAKWPLRRPIVAIRDILQQALVFPLLRVLYRIEIHGTEHLRSLSSPVLFAANHSAQWDVGMVPFAIPHYWRAHLAIVAASERVYYQRWRGFLSSLLGNAFPFDRYNALRPSLDYLGKLLDDGWNVLIFPEGDLTLNGPIQPFKSGTGMTATEASTPVIPIGLQVVKSGLAEGNRSRFRGSVVIRFGPALHFPRGTSPIDATEQIENAVRALVPGQSRQVAAPVEQVTTVG